MLLTIKVNESIEGVKKMSELIKFCEKNGLEICVANTVVQSKKSEPLPEKKSEKKSKKSELHLPAEKTEERPIKGEKIWQEDLLTVVNDDGKFRLYIHSRNKKVRYAIKCSAGDFGAVWSGDHNKNIYHWTFEDEDHARQFIQSRKDWNEANKKEG